VPTASPTPGSAPAPRRIADLSREETRAELNDAAIEAILKLADFWRLKSREAALLLGESERTWFRIKANQWDQVLSQDNLTRASAMIGIFKGLHLLFSDPLADEWVRTRNNDPLFGGLSPVEFMIQGGIEAMLDTRRYIDALRGGL